MIDDKIFSLMTLCNYSALGCVNCKSKVWLLSDIIFLISWVLFWQKVICVQIWMEYNWFRFILFGGSESPHMLSFPSPTHMCEGKESYGSHHLRHHPVCRPNKKSSPETRYSTEYKAWMITRKDVRNPVRLASLPMLPARTMYTRGAPVWSIMDGSWIRSRRRKNNQFDFWRDAAREDSSLGVDCVAATLFHNGKSGEIVLFKVR